LYNYRGAVFQRDGNLALALQDYNTAITLYEEDGDDESIADMQERIEEIETIMDSQ
jgi:hypothetical protein